MKTSTILIGGAVVGLGVLYLKGAKQIETASGSKPPGFSLANVLNAVRAGLKGYSGDANENPSTARRIGDALDGILGSILGAAPAVAAAADVRYDVGAELGPNLSHDRFRTTELSAGTRIPTWSDDAVVGVYSFS